AEILVGRFRKRRRCLKVKRFEVLLHLIKVDSNGARIGGRCILAWSHTALQSTSEKQKKGQNPHAAGSCDVYFHVWRSRLLVMKYSGYYTLYDYHTNVKA
ncbi:MAG: hypothetical protein V3W07_05095, partial [Syntrophobacteria bacterium]